MKLIPALALLLIFASCNSDTKEPSTAGTLNSKGHTWSTEDDKAFLLECVQGASTRLDETQAFKHCNCVLANVKVDFPNLDSAIHTA
jgi:hypothetical protein